MLADDLVGAIALDALGARIPARHASLRVEHEDGVVLHCLDEQAKALLALAQQLFLATALCQIARDLGEAAHLAFGIVQRRDRHARPEQAAVLAHTPALVLDTAFLRGEFELALRPAALQGILRIEHREMLSQDFGGAVSLDALGAGIPADDLPFAVEQENRIVLHALDQQLQRVVDAEDFSRFPVVVRHPGSKRKPSNVSSNA